MGSAMLLISFQTEHARRAGVVSPALLILRIPPRSGRSPGAILARVDGHLREAAALQDYAAAEGHHPEGVVDGAARVDVARRDHLRPHILAEVHDPAAH